jgi:terminase small subunit-like protein
MGEVVEAAAAARPQRTRVWFSSEIGREICVRVAAGETVTAICREERMPNRGTVTAWAKAHGRFRRALARAKTLGGWDHERGGGRRGSYCEVTAMEVFVRLSLGEPITRICEDPQMPSQSTVALWRARYPEFAERMARARQVQAERFCDLGWEIASAVTPADAYATDVKLRHLRWTAGTLSPARYGRHKLVEAEATLELEAAAPAATPAQTEVIFTVRHFKAEAQPDGTKKVVAYLRDSRTGLLRREHPEDGEDNTPTKDAGPGEWLAG